MSSLFFGSAGGDQSSVEGRSIAVLDSHSGTSWLGSVTPPQSLSFFIFYYRVWALNFNLDPAYYSASSNVSSIFCLSVNSGTMFDCSHCRLQSPVCSRELVTATAAEVGD